MAKLFAVAIRDRAVDAFNRPFFVPSLGLAIRSFSDEVNRADASNPMNGHPEDFELFHLGDYDEDSGMFTNLPNPKSLSIASNVLVKKEV